MYKYLKSTLIILVDYMNATKNNATKNEVKTSELLSAIKSGDIDRAKNLMDNGADVNAKDKKGRTILMYAAVHGYAEIAKLLMDNGAEVNAKDKDGMTALMYTEYTEIAKLLRNKT